MYCGLESAQAVVSSVRKRQRRRQEWESGGPIIWCLVFRFSKNSRAVRERGDKYQKVYLTSACFCCHHPRWSVGRPTVMVAGRSKCQATGRSLAAGELTGPGRSQGTEGPGRTVGCTGERSCEGVWLWKQHQILVLSHHIPCISRQRPAPFSSVPGSCVQSFSWLGMLLCG